MCDAVWDGGPEMSPGDRSIGGWRRMGVQSVRAYKYLVSVKQLTVDALCATHRILMSGGLPSAGSFRECGAHADGWTFPNAADVQGLVEDALGQFERAVNDQVVHPVDVATQLMFEFVSTHPFENGNGRMCRMLFSYALHRFGYPFPVVLCSGHSNSYRHYIQALVRAQQRGDGCSQLRWLAWMSVSTAIANALNYLRIPLLVSQ